MKNYDKLNGLFCKIPKRIPRHQIKHRRAGTNRKPNSPLNFSRERERERDVRAFSPEFLHRDRVGLGRGES